MSNVSKRPTNPRGRGKERHCCSILTDALLMGSVRVAIPLLYTEYGILPPPQSLGLFTAYRNDPEMGEAAFFFGGYRLFTIYSKNPEISVGM